MPSEQLTQFPRLRVDLTVVGYRGITHPPNAVVSSTLMPCYLLRTCPVLTVLAVGLGYFFDNIPLTFLSRHLYLLAPSSQMEVFRMSTSAFSSEILFEIIHEHNAAERY